MPINTNGCTIYAPEGTTFDEIVEALETDEALWSKVENPYRKSPRNWLLDCNPKDFRYTKGRDTDNAKQISKAWSAVKVVCECGRTVAQGKLARHKATAIHLQALAAQEL